MATGGKLTDLTSAAAVKKALAEFLLLGREAFISKYSVSDAAFGKSRDYFVMHDGLGFDSKPIVAAAYGFQHGRSKALHSDDFSGGLPVIAKMAELGFKVARWTSPELSINALYTRQELRAQFGIVDATIDTGVFRPKGTNSIWLFVTKTKTKDRTQYDDRLDGDILYWQGQSRGRTDASIIGHEANSDELLVFYRESKRQHPSAAFRYEGLFRYVSHEGSHPANFVFQRWTAQESVVEPDFDFDPESLDDGREKTLAMVRRRQGQPAFRRMLLKSYEGKCAVTGCSVEPLLEAAHIRPYFGKATNVSANGLLLRADIHTLFDAGLISIADDRHILVSARISSSEYAALQASHIREPRSIIDRPSEKALAWHRGEHGFD
jgi:putative restriction endonuclease